MTTDRLIALATILAGLVTLAWIVQQLRRSSDRPKPVEHTGWEGEHADELDDMLREQRTGELPTIDAWERQQAAERLTFVHIDSYVSPEHRAALTNKLPAPDGDPDDTQLIHTSAVRARVDLDTTLAIDRAWNRTAVEVPVVVPVAGEAVVLTETAYVGRHRDWWQAGAR